MALQLEEVEGAHGSRQETRDQYREWEGCGWLFYRMRYRASLAKLVRHRTGSRMHVVRYWTEVIAQGSVLRWRGPVVVQLSKATRKTKSRRF